MSVVRIAPGKDFERNHGFMASEQGTGDNLTSEEL